MNVFRYRCSAITNVGGHLDDMPPPMQVHFEPLGEDAISMLNRHMMFSPVMARREAQRFEPGAEYEFTVRKINGQERPQA